MRLGHTCCLRFHSVFRFRSKASFDSNEPCLSRTRRAEFGLAEGESVEYRRRRELVTQKFGTSVSGCMRACKEEGDPIAHSSLLSLCRTRSRGQLHCYFVSSHISFIPYRYDLYNSIVYKHHCFPSMLRPKIKVRLCLHRERVQAILYPVRPIPHNGRPDLCLVNLVLKQPLP